mmetsp:Transcript_5721/g.35627  ORF Transcript_5721/g.35627 Transcript_5721/m.35627 type:complete len:260 (+) Transcript_5721:768-1547(+)
MDTCWSAHRGRFATTCGRGTRASIDVDEVSGAGRTRPVNVCTRIQKKKQPGAQVRRCHERVRGGKEQRVDGGGGTNPSGASEGSHLSSSLQLLFEPFSRAVDLGLQVEAAVFLVDVEEVLVFLHDFFSGGVAVESEDHVRLFGRHGLSQEAPTTRGSSLCRSVALCFCTSVEGPVSTSVRGTPRPSSAPPAPRTDDGLLVRLDGHAHEDLRPCEDQVGQDSRRHRAAPLHVRRISLPPLTTVVNFPTQGSTGCNEGEFV